MLQRAIFVVQNSFVKPAKIVLLETLAPYGRSLDRDHIDILHNMLMKNIALLTPVPGVCSGQPTE